MAYLPFYINHNQSNLGKELEQLKKDSEFHQSEIDKAQS
jgi:hypothetical protein